MRILENGTQDKGTEKSIASLNTIRRQFVREHY